MIDPRQPDYSCTPADPRRARFGYAPAGEAGEIEPRGRTPLTPALSGSPQSATGRAGPSVSIMTPYYNTGAIFHETAASVFAQSFQDWEWIIVNDGSSDPSALAVLDEYRERDPRVRVLDLPENRGLSAARNAGYAAARADLVMQIDSDDMAEPTFLEKCLWFMRTNPQWGFVCGWTVGFGHENYLWGQGFHNIDRFLQENLVTPTSVVRKSVWEAAEGYDEANRKGLEDWDFWLRCGASGHWGACIPEFLDWYRRRPNHNSSWGNWDRGPNQERFSAEMRAKYAALYENGLPRPAPTWPTALSPLPAECPLRNPLAKDRPRLLMIVPWLRFGGADKFNLDLIQQMTGRGWEVSIAATLEGDQSWLSQYARLTPDVFALERFVRPHDRALFLRYLVESRRPDVVMVTNSELGYHALPYLRACCPGPAYVDLTHIEEEGWKSGGYPRYGVASQDSLEMNIVVSEHLKRWMVERGGEADRIEVCHINVDPAAWSPCEAERRRVREEHGIPDDATVLLYPARLCAQKQPRVLAKTLRLLAGDPPPRPVAAMSDAQGEGLRGANVPGSVLEPGTPPPPSTRRSEQEPAEGARLVALIAGDGEDRAWLESFIVEHGLERHVRMLGAQTPEAMPALYRASDILFLPSKWEGIALSIYEAMAAGLCVVGADVGGQSELVTPDTGVLLSVAGQGEDAQAEQYARALRGLLADPARCAAFGAAARARIERGFTLDAMGRRMDDLLATARRWKVERPRPLIPRRLGEELVVRATDYFRLQKICERAARTAQAHAAAAGAPGAAPSARAAKGRRGRPGERAPGSRRGPKGRGRRRSASMAELKVIESSRAWRMIEAARRSMVYAIYARLRHGRSWRACVEAARALPPEQRLAHLKASGAFRLVQRVKSSALYRLVRRPVAIDTTGT